MTWLSLIILLREYLLIPVNVMIVIGLVVGLIAILIHLLVFGLIDRQGGFLDDCGYGL